MNKKKLKTYKVTQDSDVFAISLVEAPATESAFVYMSEQKPMKFNTDEEKHMVYGCAMLPDFPIYRRLEKEEFYVTFPKDTIERLSQNFLKQGFQKNWTKNHDEEANGITVVESWIKADMEKDKSVAIGLDNELPVGTWFVGAKVDDVDLWDKIKNGEWNGFSIEAFIELDEIESKFSIETTIDEDSFLDKLKGIINEALGRNVQPQPSTDNTIVQPQQGEIVEEIVTPMSEEGQPTVQEQPTVEQPAQVEQEVVEEQPQHLVEPVEQPTEPQVEEQPQEQPNEADELKDMLGALTNELAEIRSQLEALKAENARLASLPSAHPVNINRSTAPTKGLIEQIDALRNGTYFK